MLRSRLRIILIAGLLAGTLDILDAIVFYGLRSHIPPMRILQSVCSGLLGRAAYTGGWPTALLGLLLHFLIALIWATLFVFVAGRFPSLRRWPISSGVLYGGFVYFVMNFAVVPLSRFPKSHAPLPAIVFVNGVLAILLLIGVPIALVTRHFSPPPPVS